MNPSSPEVRENAVRGLSPQATFPCSRAPLAVDLRLPVGRAGHCAIGGLRPESPVRASHIRAHRPARDFYRNTTAPTNKPARYPGGGRAADPAGSSASTAPSASAALPRLLDLGADKCIPCKKLAPILEELKKEYAGSLEVVFIDVWKNPSAALQYGIEAIPTQIFFGASGKELFRHEGFYSKQEILAKWQELGVTLAKPPSPPGP